MYTFDCLSDQDMFNIHYNLPETKKIHKKENPKKQTIKTKYLLKTVPSRIFSSQENLDLKRKFYLLPSQFTQQEQERAVLRG